MIDNLTGQWRISTESDDAGESDDEWLLEKKKNQLMLTVVIVFVEL